MLVYVLVWPRLAERVHPDERSLLTYPSVPAQLGRGLDRDPVPAGRRQYLLGYFGEVLEEPCGLCDNCDAGLSAEQPDPGESPFPINMRVRHASWGTGVVTGYEEGRIVVLFEEAGYRTLDLELIERKELLSPA